MYCDHCHGEMYYKDLENCGWCIRCGAIVHTTECTVTYWNLMAVFTMLWPLAVA